MLARIRIPPWQKAAFKALATLGAQERAGLLQTVSTLTPTLDLEEIGKSLSANSSIDSDTASGILDVLVGLHGVRENLGLDLNEFIREVRRAAEEDQDQTLIPKDWAEFAQFLTNILSLDTGLAAAAKALFVSQEYPNLYCKARVLTDLRPIFGARVEDLPTALVTAHALKITYHSGTSTEDFFVALDRKDISDLISVLERAIKKDDSLKRLTQSKGLTLLSVGS
jgi:hypothetical protein